MNVRFTRHALKRLRGRFGPLFGDVTAMFQRPLTENTTILNSRDRLAVEGAVRGRAARVIFTEDSPGEVTIITAMWCK